jgi:hypothetical protein
MIGDVLLVVGVYLFCVGVLMPLGGWLSSLIALVDD